MDVHYSYPGKSIFSSLSSAMFYAYALILPKDGQVKNRFEQFDLLLTFCTGTQNRRVILYHEANELSILVK